MFRHSIYQRLKENMAERHQVRWDDPLSSDMSEFTPISHPEINKYMKFVEIGYSKSKSQQLNKIIKLAKDGDKICQEFLAFQYPFFKAHEEQLSEEEDVDTDIISDWVESDDNESGEETSSQKYNPLDMAKKSVEDHQSALGHYVLFKHNRQKRRTEEAAKHLTTAIESNNPDVRLDLFLWLDPINIGMIRGFSEYIAQLAEHSQLFGAFLYFCINKMNPFISLTALKVHNDLIQKKLLASYLEKGDVENAWKELETMKTMEMTEAPDLALLVLVSGDIRDPSKTTWRDMVTYKTQNADFKEYINNHPVLSHFVNENYLKQVIATRKIFETIFSEDETQDEKNEIVNQNLELISKNPEITIILELMDIRIEYKTPETKLVKQFLNSVESSSAVASAFIKFHKALLEENFTNAAQYFIEIDKSAPLKAFMVLQILHFTNSSVFNGFIQQCFELKNHSPAFQQFVNNNAGYLSCLNQEGVLEKSRVYGEESSDDSDEESFSPGF
ncbi:MAG: hypothetical protein Q8M03_03985 [Legionella sp.]|nr:hypothetical protein [Legionella sp.]